MRISMRSVACAALASCLLSCLGSGAGKHGTTAERVAVSSQAFTTWSWLKGG